MIDRIIESAYVTFRDEKILCPCYALQPVDHFKGAVVGRHLPLLRA